MLQMIDLLEFIKIAILSIVQGITEWLPISSTGHMIIIEDLMPLTTTAEFKEMFFVLVQLGSILAVVVLFFHKLNPFAPSKSSEERMNTWKLWFKVAFASIPVAIFGLALDKYMDMYLNSPLVVALMLIVYGFGFLWIENSEGGRHQKVIRNVQELSYPDAFKIGAFQALSIIPGTSRSGATIMGALLLGTSREVATEFSFFLGIPAMFGASLLKLVKFGFDFTQEELIYLLGGMLIAFIVSLIVIRFLLTYIRRHDFKIFGYYRIALGALIILYFLFQL